ncbi:MAG: Fic family protein [bacterium]
MNKQKVVNLLQTEFLQDFTFSSESLKIDSKLIKKYDEYLNLYQRLVINPDIEKNLISRNELLVSYAISKAENSALTLLEAERVYHDVINDSNIDFVGEKIRSGKKISKKDYEKLEFYNIAKVFHELSQNKFVLTDITPEFIQNLHKSLTKGLDIFSDQILGFTVYRSGKWRNNNQIKVATYAPASYKVIPVGISRLLKWLKKDFTITNIAVFHTGLYALHPFNNGNKRVCRIIEHLLFQISGLNQKNLYSTSYYYHKQKERYYKYLLASLDKKNLNYFTSFVLEALILSITDVLRTSIEVQRKQFLIKLQLEKKYLIIFKPLIKYKELQYKKIWKKVRTKLTNKTFVTYLQYGLDLQYLKKRVAGKKTFYALNVDFQEEIQLQKWLDELNKRLDFIPDDYRQL